MSARRAVTLALALTAATPQPAWADATAQAPPAGTPAPSGAAAAGGAASAGVSEPFRPPSATALRLNAEGTALYRQEKWDEARARFRAALQAEPGYLSPLLNVACSYVRQERFDEATSAVVELLRRGGPVPWHREIVEAADLGALLVRPDAMRTLREAFAAAAQAWGEGLTGAVLFVARLAEPLKLPASGVAVLGPRQEVFAWLPSARLYRRLTVEDGRVVGVTRSPDGKRALVVLAEKVLRDQGRSTALRGVAVRELMLGGLAAGPALAVPGDVLRLSVFFRRGEFFVSAVTADGARNHVLRDRRLVPVFERCRDKALLVVLPDGPEPARPFRVAGACPTSVRELRRPRGPAALEARTCSAKKPLIISPPLGGSMTGPALD